MGALILAVIVSGFIAGAVQLQLGVWYHAQEEFILTMLALAGFTLFAGVVFGLALFLSRWASGVNRAAIILLLILGMAVVGLAGWSILDAGSLAALQKDEPILIEIFVPGLIVILIQWWFLRRRYRARVAGA